MCNPSTKTWVYNGDCSAGKPGQRACAQIIG